MIWRPNLWLLAVGPPRQDCIQRGVFAYCACRDSEGLLLGRGSPSSGCYRSGLACSNWRSRRLPRTTAESSAAWADFLPATACSSSFSITLRIRPNDPSRTPLELSVGGFRGIDSVGITV